MPVVVLWLIFGVGVTAAAWLTLSLWLEGARRAAYRVSWAAYAFGFVWVYLIYHGTPQVHQVLVFLALSGLLAVTLLAVRGLGYGHDRAGNPVAVTPADAGVGPRGARTDERDTLFARMAYTPGGAAFEDYYTRRAERQAEDEELRDLPQLCGPGSATHHPLNSRIAPAIFELVAGWHGQAAASDPTAERPPSDQTGTDPAAMSTRVKGLARLYGALDAGICELDPAAVYTNVGRREGEYGVAIQPDLGLGHRWAVVFTVAMDYRYLASAPRLPVVVESSNRYLDAAKTALALAANIRALGWSARAHIDGNYLGILPPLAAAAGLGEIGRLGLLVTEDHGPRVRLGMVTTDLPLVTDRPRSFGLASFCRRCLKCARNCPGQAISREDLPATGGWSIAQESCYRYWRRTGTDCAACVISCPYAKPSTPFHQLTRVIIRGFPAAQRVALWLDDFLYGRRPQDTWTPDWF